MNSVMEAGEGGLVSSRWKNKEDVYSHPETHTRGGRVPPLVWFCLQCISEFPDQIRLPLKLAYRPSVHRPPKSFRLLDRLLIHATSRRSDNASLDAKSRVAISKVDPRLWATIVQIFDHIPSELRTYTVPLNDELLPLLQGIPNTDTFSLITILELPGCSALVDSSIAELRFLHTLAAFDASNTRLSADGILSLARTLQANSPLEETRKLRGPWGLRVLRLKHCNRIEDTVYQTLPKFPLLSVVDLRGTKCHPPATSGEFEFLPSQNRALFSSDMALSLDALQQHEDVQAFSSKREYQFILRVKKLCHPSVADALAQAESRARLRFSPSLAKSSESWYGEYQETQGYDDYNWDERSEPYSDDFEMDWRYQSDSEVDGDDGEGEEEEREVKGHQEENLARSEGSEGEGGNVGSSSASDDREPTFRRISSHTHSVKRSNSSLHEIHDDGAIIPSSQELRPPKRPRTSVAISGPFGESISVQDADSTALGESESNSDDSSDDYSYLKLPMTRPSHRKLYWYDADWERTYTYVPMSLPKGKYDDRLMLYRPMRPWSWLEEELNGLLEKEARWEEIRANRNAPVVVSVAHNKRLKAQEGLQFMTAAALQRRQMDSSRPKYEPLQMSSKNPFAKPPGTSRPLQSGNTEPQAGPSTQKPLRPISTLRVPKFTQDLVKKNMSNGAVTQDLSGKQKFTEAPTSRELKNSVAAARSLLTRAPLAPSKAGFEGSGSISTDPAKGCPKRRGIRILDPSPTTSSSTSSKSGNTNRSKTKGGGKGKQSQQSSFDWAAWASKKA